jgi:large conductance mechanosensitive channel
MFEDFKKFIMRGNVLDLAVGVILGAAFTKITNSMVNDIIMPVVGLVAGKGTNFNEYFAVLKRAEGQEGVTYATREAAAAAKAITLNYGAFITTVLDFLIVALAVFIVVKIVNKMHDLAAKPLPIPAPLGRKPEELKS